MNPKILIDSIVKNLRLFIGNTFGIIQRSAFHYIIKGESSALNRFDNPQELVSVLKWFNDFWVFLEIKFKKEEKIGSKKESLINTCISLSVFQGEDGDKEKNQLFRAEWDDYNNSDENHAQPHWHITSSQAIENTFAKYADAFDKQDFIELLESEKQKVLDVKKIHFAMSADWQAKNGEHLHKMEDEQQIVNWLQGMLTYLRFELAN